MRIKTQSIDLYVEHGGLENGPPLFFIRGSGGDLRNKPNQFDSPLAKHFYLTSYDQRGLGQSAVPAGDYSMADYADDAAYLLDALEIDQIPVMGVSFGGMVGQEFVLRHPDRVTALVLACTSAGGRGGASYPLHDLHHLDARERAQAHLKVADLRHTDEWISANPDKWEKRIELSMAGRSAAKTSGEDGAWKQLLARKDHDTFDRLHQIKVPTLLAGGSYDGIAPKANMQLIQEQIKGAELNFFEGGHMFLIQDKNAYPAIIAWIEAVLNA